MLLILLLVGGVALLFGLVVVSVVGFSYLRFRERSQNALTRAELMTISTALDLYYADQGEYPRTGEWANALVRKGTDGSCFMKGCQLPRDPWQEDYRYRHPGMINPEGFDLCSKGPDRQEGTADDICNRSY